MGQPGQPPGVPTVASLSAEAGIAPPGGGIIEIPGAPAGMPPTLESPPGGEHMLKTQLCKSAGRDFKLRTYYYRTCSGRKLQMIPEQDTATE